MSGISSHQLINQSSGDFEYYTPKPILSAARELLGGIHLDPASSPEANKHVCAYKYFCEPEFVSFRNNNGCVIRHYADWGGLSHDWNINVWLNPPFGSPEKGCKLNCTKKICRKRGWCTANDLPGMNHWVDKFIDSYKKGTCVQGLMICFAATSEKWFQPLLNYPQCFLSPRTNYLTPGGGIKKGVSKGSVITYVGANVDMFKNVFLQFGVVK